MKRIDYFDLWRITLINSITRPSRRFISKLRYTCFYQTRSLRNLFSFIYIYIYIYISLDMDYLFKILSSINLFLNVKIDAIFIPLLLLLRGEKQ